MFITIKRIRFLPADIHIHTYTELVFTHQLLCFLLKATVETERGAPEKKTTSHTLPNCMRNKWHCCEYSQHKYLSPSTPIKTTHNKNFFISWFKHNSCLSITASSSCIIVSFASSVWWYDGPLLKQLWRAWSQRGEDAEQKRGLLLNEEKTVSPQGSKHQDTKGSGGFNPNI